MASTPTSSDVQLTPALSLAGMKHVGIDKIALRYQVQKVSPKLAWWVGKHYGKQIGWEGFLIPGGDDELGFLFPAPIRFKFNKEYRSVTIEFNPSRMTDPEGSSLATVAETQYWCERVIRALADVVTPEFITVGGKQDSSYMTFVRDWKSRVTISRLDITRDFHSNFRSFDISRLMDVKRPRITSERVYLTGKYMSGLSWGSEDKKNYRITVYDKSLKHDKIRNGGWYRFEAQLYWKALKKYGLGVLAGVTDKGILSCLKTKWDKGLMSTEVTIPEGNHSIYEALLTESSETKRQTFLGVAYSMAQGFPVNLSASVIREYRKLGEKVGFQLGSSLTFFGGKVVHIDFEKGLVVDTWNPNTYTETVFSPDDILGINPISNYLEP